MRGDAEALGQRSDLIVDRLFRYELLGLGDRVAFEHDGLEASGAVRQARFTLDGAIARTLGGQVVSLRDLGQHVNPGRVGFLEFFFIVGGGGERGGDLRGGCRIGLRIHRHRRSAVGRLLAQRQQRVEHIQAAPAAHIALPGAQIGRGDGERQGALGADGKHRESQVNSRACAQRRIPASATQPSRLAKRSISNHFRKRSRHFCLLAGKNSGQQHARTRRQQLPQTADSAISTPPPGYWRAARRNRAAISAALLAQLQAVGHGVVGRILARGEQRLRVDIECIARGARRASAPRSPARRRRSRSPLTVACRTGRVPSSHCRHMRGGWMGAGTEGEAGVEPHHHRLRIGHRLMPRADPQPRTEAHGVKIAQPFALPGAIGNRARAAAAAHRYRARPRA